LPGWKQVPVYPTVLKLVSLSNAVSFFGKDLGEYLSTSLHRPCGQHREVPDQPFPSAKDEQFMETALKFVEQSVICAEILRLVPKWIVAPLIGRIITWRLKSPSIMFNTLKAVAEQRYHERDLAKAGQMVPAHVRPYSISFAQTQATWLQFCC